MNILLIFPLLLITVSAGPKEKKTTLEDIERDYVSSESKTKLTPPPPPPSRSPSKVNTPSLSPTLFGFVPKKTIADYVQQTQRPAYLQPQYTQQYIPNDDSQYATVQQYVPPVPQKSFVASQYSSPQQYISQQQKYTSQVPSQQAYSYVQLPSQLQSLENVQYITDNSIGGQSASQYYTPQYVYLQQYTSPSTAVQTVVEPKGGLQYIMYVPSYVPSTAADQSQNYENVVYSGDDAQVLTSSYQVPQSAQPTQYVQQKEHIQTAYPKDKYTKAEYIIRREPKSLLDSYVPSIVQLQYYNRIQQNSVQEPIKISQTAGGKQYVKNSYSPEGPSDAETTLTYQYQPSSYRS